jgi:succinyl-diaminopimelate desuccinylase
MATWCRPARAGARTPTAAIVVDGKLYGRAAAVSKSDFATYTFALRAARVAAGARPALRAALRGAVELHFTYDEEFGGELGPGWLLRQGLTKPDYLIAAGFGYQVVTAHNGCLQMEVTLDGLSACRLSRNRGRRAAGRRRLLQALYAPQRRAAPAALRGGGHHAPLPERRPHRGRHQHQCGAGQGLLKLDRRMIPEEDEALVESRAAPLHRDASAPPPPGIRLRCAACCWRAPPQPDPRQAPLVQAAAAPREAVFGEPIPECGTPLYTDVRLYGAAGVPAVIYGAGPRSVLESNAKRADEHLRLDDLHKATRVVARTLHDFLRP